MRLPTRPGVLLAASVIGLTACALFAAAPQPPLLILQATATAQPPPPTPAPQASNPEADALKAQLQLLHQYSAQQTDTVRWTVGIAFTLVLFAAGAGWYANIRLSERDRDSIRLELETRMDRQLAQQSKDLQDSVAATTASLQKTTQEHLDASSEEIARSIASTRESLSSEIDLLRHDVLRLQYGLMEQEALSWQQQGVHSNVVRVYLRMVPLARQIAWDWMISRALEGMETAIRKAPKLEAEVVREITATLADLPADYAIVADRIRARLTG